MYWEVFLEGGIGIGIGGIGIIGIIGGKPKLGSGIGIGMGGNPSGGNPPIMLIIIGSNGGIPGGRFVFEGKPVFEMRFVVVSEAMTSSSDLLREVELVASDTCAAL